MSALIIDAQNLYIRCFVAASDMNVHGEPMGGCLGFLRSMRKIIENLKPNRVYVIWEGGGSQRRRSIYSAYKQNRKPIKLNRFYEDDIPETEENRQKQLLKLLELLKATPVCQLYVANCEADDVIAHLCCNSLKNEDDKVILSSDRDMFQLLSNKTRVFSPQKKRYVTEEDVFKDFQVTPENFAIAKALCGDSSDNIPGVKGMGFKTVAKRFPFLGRKEPVLLQEVLDYAAAHVDESTAYKRVLEETDIVKRNWKLVFLDGSMMSASQQAQVNSIVDTYKPTSDKIRFIKALTVEGMGSFDVSSFFMAFNCIDGLSYKTTTA